MKNRIFQSNATALAVLALAACSSGPSGSGGSGGRGPLGGAFGGSRPERPSLPPTGEPGIVAAADVAFAKAAREEGAAIAFGRYAASGAVMHLGDGPVAAAGTVAARQNPEDVPSWGPNAVWTSCDGSLAVSFGKFQEPDGLVGTYASAWELQSDGEYRFTYMLGSIDDPQPPPRAPLPDVDVSETMIVVPGLTSIRGQTADCGNRGDQPAAPLSVIANSSQYETTQSADGTLTWRWEHRADGTRLMTVTFMRDGSWQQAMEFIVPPPEQ